MDDRLWLFSYGTLRQPEVQRATFGRELAAEPDALPGFVLKELVITDPHVIALSGSDRHLILHPGGAESLVHGVALAVIADDLAKADRYEVAAYVRVAATLASGRRAFVYVARTADEP